MHRPLAIIVTLLFPLALMAQTAGPTATAAQAPAGVDAETPVPGDDAEGPVPGDLEAPTPGDLDLPAADDSDAPLAPDAAAPAPGADAATRTPELLAPVDRWREDPQLQLNAVDIDLEQFRWIARPLVVFADSEADPAFQQQLDYLGGRADDLALRDVVVITDTDPAALSDVRRKLRPRGFMLALIGKDGGVKLRKPFPWDVREISRSIDKMPIRLQELREERNANQ